MIITKSNVLAGITPTITAGISTDLPQNITDQDFSVFYKSSDLNSLAIDFGATPSISYVSVAGINNKGNRDYTSYVAVNDGATEILRISINSDQVVVLQFEARVFANLRVRIFNGAATSPIVKFISAGNYLTVPNSGEQAGYNRNFLERNFKNKTTLNKQAEPVALVRSRKQAKGRLNIPNASLVFAEGEWQDFLDFAEENLFFILERPLTINGSGLNVAPAAYLCYEMGVNSAKAHAQTRSLNALSISFKVYNGL